MNEKTNRNEQTHAHLSSSCCCWEFSFLNMLYTHSLVHKKEEEGQDRKTQSLVRFSFVHLQRENEKRRRLVMSISTRKKRWANSIRFKGFLHLNPWVEYLVENFAIAFDYYHLQLLMKPYLPFPKEDLRLLNRIYRHFLSIDYSHLKLIRFVKKMINHKSTNLSDLNPYSTTCTYKNNENFSNVDEPENVRRKTNYHFYNSLIDRLTYFAQ